MEKKMRMVAEEKTLLTLEELKKNIEHMSARELIGAWAVLMAIESCNLNTHRCIKRVGDAITRRAYSLLELNATDITERKKLTKITSEFHNKLEGIG